MRNWCVIVGVIDIVLFLLLFLLPFADSTGDYKIIVRDAQTGKVIPGAKISASITIDDKEDSITIETDNNGVAEMPFDDDSDYINDMYITKEGYDGKRIYHKQVGDTFDDDKKLVVELDVPTSCSDQMQSNRNRDKGMHNVEDYDMGQDSGTFVFEYFTDTAPDEIIVYDGSSNQIGQCKVLYHYNGATNLDVISKRLKFSSRIVSVVVNGGTNWYYIMHCPRD